jgi:non-heme chloroperoxidase
MPRITVGTENDAPIEIHSEDHGSGQPVVLIHGYPLNANSWERQERELLAADYRCISYDRRGFGRSSQPTAGYDYDTFAADLNTLLEHLDLTDVILAGFSMGTGEVTRYLGTFGSARVRKAALFGAIPPFLLKTADNPEGVDGQVFEDIKAAIVKDRYAYFKDFLDNFYNVDVLAPDRISDQAWQASFNVAVGSSPYATYACVNTWLTDFRDDLPKIDVPTLVVDGTEDPHPAVRGHRRTPRRAHRGRDGRAGRGWPAQHRLDAPRGGQRSAARLPRGHHSCPGIRRMTEQTMEFLVETKALRRYRADSEAQLAGRSALGRSARPTAGSRRKTAPPCAERYPGSVRSHLPA